MTGDPVHGPLPMPYLLLALLAAVIFMAVPSAKDQTKAQAQECRIDLPAEQTPSHCKFR